MESLEREMELLCLTGVEDQLQADVRPTLELLRNAGIKVHVICGQKYVNTQTNINSWVFLYVSDLDVDRRQAGNCYVYRQKFPLSF